MNIHLIIAQYPIRYAGELMPNVVDAWDEYVIDDNPQGYQDALAKHKALVADGTYEDMRVAIVNVLDNEITNLFKTPTFKASI